MCKRPRCGVAAQSLEGLTSLVALRIAVMIQMARSATIVATIARPIQKPIATPLVIAPRRNT
jgi:hypothetical protein